MSVSFADYLNAKFALDERSLNGEVRRAYEQALHSLPKIECLDVGAGTGASLRRLLASSLSAPLSVTALDRDTNLLDIARRDIPGWLGAVELKPHMQDGAIRTCGEMQIDIRFADGELKHHRPDRIYNVITAHAFLDLAPLRAALRQFAAWLEPGGYLYTSINYDGDTALLPVYEDSVFEADLLSHYNRTMELRRVDGLATGGAYCGRRLRDLLPGYGFEILAAGDSAWNISPVRQQYRDRDAICLEALLGMIYGEGRGCDLFAVDELDRWRDARKRCLQQGLLELRIQHLDFLARYRP